MVKFSIPSSKEEALKLLSSNTYQIVSGGTDFMVVKRNTPGLPPKEGKDILYVANLEQLHYIVSDDEGVHIGATTPLFEIEESSLVIDVLRHAISEMASPNIRHFATLAGNIANASPAGDSLVPLVLLDASVKLESEKASRLVKVEDFVFGVRKILLQPDEMITEIFIPHHDFTFTEWYKVGSRKADSISKVSFAGAYEISRGKIKDFRVCFGSVSIKAVRSHEIENKLKGVSLSSFASMIPSLIEEYGKIVTPIDDQRSNKEYRHKVAMNILADFLNGIK